MRHNFKRMKLADLQEIAPVSSRPFSEVVPSLARPEVEVEV